MMNDFQTISEIVNDSVRSSSYITVLISSSIFIIYTLVVKIVDYFKAKSKNKPLLEMANAIKENTANVVKLNSVLDKTLKDAERKEIKQCEASIELGFNSLAYNIYQECASIIVHNNIAKNRNLIVENIRKIVSTEYYKLYSTLSSFDINDINVASKLKDSWIKEIVDDVISIIYDEQDSLSRLTQLNNRLAVSTQEYSTYINNKIFNT